jgi:SAM-dependent methyltransferase
MPLPDYSWQIETELDPAALRGLLAPFRPFRIEINFSNGFSTREFGDAVRYTNSQPLAKLHYFESQIPIDASTRILDIGCNFGYYWQHYIMSGVHSAIGVEFDGRLFSAAMVLRQIANLNHKNNILIHGDFSHPIVQHAVAQHGHYDLILFLGVVNGIPSFTSALLGLPPLLRPGGALVLEYTAVESSERVCRFHPNGEGFPDDPSHIWTFSEPFIDDFLAANGVNKVGRALEWKSPDVLGEYKKVTSIYRKSDSP